MDEKVVIQLNSLTLAFLGDAVFTQYVREKLVRSLDCKSGKLHLLASKYVRASAQARMLEAAELTPDEQEVARRARNCHNPSRAKNAALSDYKKATALESVFGYLKLTEQNERLDSLMEACMATINADEGDSK